MSAWRAAIRARIGALALDVELSGERGPVALVGPNGSGKTTLVRIIAGLVRPEHAEIEVGGRTLTSTERGVDVPVEARRIGYVPQGSGLFPHLSVLDNVAFGLSVRSRRIARGRRRELARATLADLECEHLAERMPSGLSGGERQRVAVARALATEPALLVLDEPLAALDATARRSVRAFLTAHLREVGCPSLIVTHEPRDVLALDADVIALDAGRVVQRGKLADLQRAPATAYLVELVADV